MPRESPTPQSDGLISTHLPHKLVAEEKWAGLQRSSGQQALSLIRIKGMLKEIMGR